MYFVKLAQCKWKVDVKMLKEANPFPNDIMYVYV